MSVPSERRALPSLRCLWVQIAVENQVLCKEHGGGKMCLVEGCNKQAKGVSGICKAHGGGPRNCSKEGCDKTVRGRSSLCLEHSGGKTCAQEGCPKAAIKGYDVCRQHGAPPATPAKEKVKNSTRQQNQCGLFRKTYAEFGDALIITNGLRLAVV